MVYYQFSTKVALRLVRIKITILLINYAKINSKKKTAKY